MTLGAAGGGTSATRSVAATGRRNGAEASRPRNAPQNRAGSPAGNDTLIPRGCDGTGCSRQIVASSPIDACAARTASSRNPGCASNAWVPGSGSTRSTVWPPTARDAVGGGANSFGCGGRSTVSASPRIVVAPSATSAVTAASSNAPSGGRTTAEPGSTSRTGLHELATCRLLGGEVCGETARDQRRDRRGGERHRRDVDERRGDHVTELGEDGGGAGGTVRVLLHAAAVGAFVPVRHPAQLIEQRRLDHQIDGADPGSARQPVERGHLCGKGATRRDGCLERGVDEPPVGIERRGCGQLDRRRDQERDLGRPDHEDDRRVDDGDLHAGSPKIDPHGVDQRVRPADAADRRKVDRRAEPPRPPGLDRVLLGERGGEDRQFGPRGERRLVRRARADRRADRDPEREVADRVGAGVIGPDRQVEHRILQGAPRRLRHERERDRHGALRVARRRVHQRGDQEDREREEAACGPADGHDGAPSYRERSARPGTAMFSAGARPRARGPRAHRGRRRVSALDPARTTARPPSRRPGRRGRRRSPA